MRRIDIRLVILFAAILCFSADAQTYLGAAAALHHVEELNAKPGQTNETADAPSKLRADLKAFRQNSTNTPADQAAKCWLELVDRAAKIQQMPGRIFNPASNPIQADDLLDSLPPPAAWKELAAAIAARPAAKGSAEMTEMGLRFLAVTLAGDAEGRKSAIASLQAKAKDATPQAMFYYRTLLQQLSQAILAMSDDPDAILMSMERQLDSISQGGMQHPLNVPNLVSQVGSEKAEAFLRKALVRSGVVLQFETPNQTSRLAQKLALELIDQLKTPQWGLVNSLDAVELYEALDKRFATETNKPTPLPGLPDADVPQEPTGPNQKPQAQVYYLLGLISKDRSKDATAVAKKLTVQSGEFMPPEAFKAMERAGYTAALDNFFYELLSQDPTLPFWDQYVDLAAKAGSTDRMLALARAAAARQDLSDNKKSAIRAVLYKALLAADAVDEGVQEMRRLLAMEPSSPSRFGVDDNHGEIGIMLAQIGLLLQKPEWTQEGIAAVKKWLTQSTGQNEFNWMSGPVVSSLEEILFKLNRGPEAESILTEALAHSVRDSKNQPEMNYGFGGPPQVLDAMAVLYHQAGRPDDVLALLEQSPDWGEADLSGFFDSSPMENEVGLRSLHAGSTALPVPYLAASALLATGRKEQAEKITNELLNRQPGLDRGYELLIALKGTDAIPRLDELFTHDQFEERPLIWKANLLRQQNKLADAETVIRQAIAIDPSDGEEGRGDRMRAYAELADILEARGNKKDADFYRQVVKAIRLSEDADEFYRAGLLKRAIPMYEEGLNHFADAYCIQSRLAVQLSELGKNQEAEEHYRRAYELMPDSFGRVESHCFGCERVFDGERAQGIAEKVFTKLAIERPDKPQVHYLLGYLREEEERYNEASTNYLAATQLDPNYLNAWIKLQGISEHVLMPPKERDEIVFSILRLDPLQRHGQPRFDHVTDLSGLWNAVDAATRRQLTPATNLFTLIASKAALEKKKSTPDQPDVHVWEEAMQEKRATLSPGRALAQTPFVLFAGQLIINDGSGLLDQ